MSLHQDVSKIPPAEGFEFVNWSGDGIANPNKAETTVAMTAARSPVARFRLIENQLPAEFRILTIQRESDGRVFLQWSSEPELTYRVESSTRLDAATWTTLLSIPATGDTTSAATEPIFSQAAFFRVRLGIE